MLDRFGYLDAFNDSLHWSLVHANDSEQHTNRRDLVHDLSNVLLQLGNTDVDGFNFTASFLESALWPALTAHQWREEAEKLLTQPEYIVMLVLCVISVLTNIMSIIAVTHIQHGLTMHLKLILNLAASDLLIVFSVLTNIFNKVLNAPIAFGLKNPSDRLMNACIFATVSSINVMSYLISLLNLLAMAFDHYIAIMRPLRYSHVMSKKHGYILIAALWTIAAIGGFSNFFFGFGFKETKTGFNYCEYVMLDGYNSEFLVFAVTLISLVAITYIYTRIYFVVRRIQSQSIMFPDQNLHNQKAMITTLLVIGTFSICWLPYCIFQIVMIIQIHLDNSVVISIFQTLQIVSKYLYIVQLMNSVLDPIIYAVRLKIVKNGYQNFINRIKKRFSRTKSCLTENESLNTHGESSRRTTITPSGAQELSLLVQTNPELAQHFESNGSSYYKVSDESDYNENELAVVVAVALNTNHDLNLSDFEDIAETAV